jgi:hypothetical protein
MYPLHPADRDSPDPSAPTWRGLAAGTALVVALPLALLAAAAPVALLAPAALVVAAGVAGVAGPRGDQVV